MPAQYEPRGCPTPGACSCPSAALSGSPQVEAGTHTAVQVEDGKTMRMASNGQIVGASGENETIANRLHDMAEDPSFDVLTRMIAGQASRDIKRLQAKIRALRPREQEGGEAPVLSADMLTAAYNAGWQASGEGWNCEHPGDAEKSQYWNEKRAAALLSIQNGSIAAHPPLPADGWKEGAEAAATCADQWSVPSNIRLAAGEMTAQELRTAQAVARGIAAAIRALLPTPQPVEGWVAARDVMDERRRQVEAEGWHTAHDDLHDGGDLARAAICYADPLNEGREHPPAKWPWDAEYWKPKNRRRDLVRAGALILAEIERLDRLPTPPASTEGGADA